LKLYTHHICLLLLLVSSVSYGQSKLSVTISNPSEIHLCIPSDYVSIEIRNISTSTITGIETKVILPAGMLYIAGSLSGAGITEKNITNLAEPVFTIPNLSITQASTLQLRVTAPCSVSSFLNNGGLAILKTTTIYSGGSVTKNGNVLLIKQPSLVIHQITNQLQVADIGDVFERQITLKNGGSGKLTRITFQRTYNIGQNLIAYTGTNTTQTGNVTTTFLDSNDFKSIGNYDIYLDQNETYIFTDSVNVLSCNNLTAVYKASWGCDSNACKNTQASANISISTRKPKLVITPHSYTTSCIEESNLHSQDLVIYNNGNDTARDIDLNIFQTYGNGYYPYSMSQLLTNSFTYQSSANGTPTSITPYKTSSTVSTGTYACLGSGAKGAVFLNLQNLAPGDSIIIKWKSKSCCPQLCNSATLYIQRWMFNASYKNQCDQLLYVNDTYGSIGQYHSFIMGKLIPTDILDGETITMEFSLSSGYLMYPSARSQLQIQLTLPPNISHTLSVNDLLFEHDNGTSWTPNYMFQRNDTVFASFNGVPTVTLTRSELKIKIKGDCGSSTSNQSQNIKLNIFYNPDTTCSSNCLYPIYCTDDNIKVHCLNGCSAGLHFRSFDTKRISYGEPDNNNDGIADASGSLNFDKIKLNKIMYGDTLLTTFRAKVNNAGSVTNWSFGKAVTTLDYGKYLSVSSASFSIYRNGNLVVTCTNVPFSAAASGNQKTYTFDIAPNVLIASGCLVYTTFTYRNTDSLVLNVKYVVDKNIGNSILDLQLDNQFYLSTVANPNNSQKYGCDSFSSRLSLVGYYFTNYGSNTINQNGCGNFNLSQNFYLSVGNCCSNYAGGNIFPYEYRKWAKLKEIILHKPVGFEVANGRFSHYRTKGTGATAYQNINSISSHRSSSTEVAYYTDSLYEDAGGNILISDDGFYGVYTANLSPTCNTATGNNVVNYSFVFERLGYLGSGLDTLFSSSTSDIVTYNPPELKITTTNDYVYPDKDTVQWDVRIANVDVTAAANNVWVGSLSTPNVQLVAIRNKATNALLPKNHDLYKLGNLSAGGYADLIVYATYVSCGKDSLFFRLGYDCIDYPDSINASNCSFYNTYLRYEPINTRLEAAVLSQFGDIDLCTDQEFEVQITNTGSPNVYNSYVDVELRQGMTLLDTAWLFIDGRTDSIVLPNYTDLGANKYRINFANRDTQFNQTGLRGVNNLNGYKMSVKFWINTNCDFTSASQFLIRPGGFLKCGTPVNAPYLLTDPLNIKNVIKPYFSSVSLHLNPLQVCSYQDSTYVKFINLGPNKTDTTDQIVISFPEGLIVDTSYIDTNHNAPVFKPSLDINNNQKLYSWKIPPNIVAGDSCVFKIKTSIDNKNLTCGLKQIYTQAIVTAIAYCVSSNTYCDIKSATSSQQQSDSVIKEAYDLAFIAAQSTQMGNDEAVNLTYSVTNTGLDKPSGTSLICQIIYDANGNGMVDTSDIRVTADTLTQAMSVGTSQTQNLSFNVSSSYTCNLLLYISNENCVCNSSTEAIRNIQLKNAGRDTIVCPNSMFTVGSIANANNNYSWNHANYLAYPDSNMSLFTAYNNKITRDTLQLILTTDKGACSSNDTLEVTIYAGMQLNMPDTANLCIGSTVLIGAVANGGESKLKNTAWSPTDSLSFTTGFVTSANPIQNTAYTLTVTDVKGCSISDSTLVQLKASPTADFSLQDSCSGTNFTFKNSSNYGSATPDSTHWDLDFLGESNFNTIGYTIDSAVIIPVRLYVSNHYKCWDTLSRYLEVFPLPNPEMTYYDACEGATTKLEAKSTIDKGTLTHNWLIDENSYVGNEVQFSVPFSDSITYTIYSTSDKGCTTTKTNTRATNDKPEISLGLINGCLYDSIPCEIVTLSGTRDSITSFAWDFGDGSAASLQTIKHIYSDSGTYAVQVIVKNNVNCADTASVAVTIYPTPHSDFSINNVCVGDTLIAIDSSTIGNGSFDINWNAGAGYTPGLTLLKIPSTQIGNFVLEQKLVSDHGCTDSSTQNYTIYYKEKLAYTIQGECENIQIQFIGTGYQPDSVAQHLWIVNGDSFTMGTFGYDFPNDGTYPVKRRIITNRGCITDSSFDVTIRPAPSAQILTSKPCEDNLVTFESGTTTTAYAWSLEDSTANSNKQFDHTFTALGSYYVWLQVTNQFGCQTAIKDSLIIDNIVIPDFKIANICEGDGQWIVNTTSGQKTPITSATFTMANGDKIDQIDSFEYTYYGDGAYNVTLQETTLTGCTYEVTKPVTIYPLPTAAFKLSPETPDVFTPEVVGTNESSGADSIRYFLSDGHTYFSPNFAHKFLDSGNYEIKQWVSSQFGCLDSITKKLYINFAYHLYIPNAFSPNVDGINEGFKPMGLGLKSYEMQIYNRWGNQVFESSDAEPVWLGIDNLSGYYLYQIRAYDFRGAVHYYSGGVYLLR
jgi:hypothetical protein